MTIDPPLGDFEVSDLKPPGPLRYLAFGFLGAGLSWAIIAHSLVAALVRIEPSYALMVRSDDPAALIRLVDHVIDGAHRDQATTPKTSQFGFGRPTDPASSPSDGAGGGYPPTATGEDVRRREDLHRWASAILAQEPGHTRALAILGQLKREAGEEERAATLLRSSALRSLREPVPHAWLVDKAIRQKDWSLAMRHADVLMRMHDQSIRPLAPLIAQMAEMPDAASIVAEAVMRAPPWRTPLFNELLNAITNARTPLVLLLALKNMPTPPTAAELQTYLNFLIERTYFDLAYYTWLQFLSPQQLATVGPLFNGSFETQPSGLPFDWVIPAQGTATVSIARRQDGPSPRALVVNFGHGRVELGATSQLLRLRPGRHHVDGKVMGEVVGRRGVRWRLTCLGDQTRQIGESEMFVGEIKDWTTFSFAMSVPDAGCAAQRLSLILDARTPSERLVSGSIWFDELSIRREPETASESAPGPDLPPQSQPRQR